MAARGNKRSFPDCGLGISSGTLPASPRGVSSGPQLGAGHRNVPTEAKACALLPSPSEVVGLSPPQRAEKDPKNTILASPYWTAEATTMKGNSNLRTKPSGFFPEQLMTSACRCSPSWAIPTTASVTRALGRGRLEPRRAKDAEVQEVGAPRPRPQQTPGGGGRRRRGRAVSHSREDASAPRAEPHRALDTPPLPDTPAREGRIRRVTFTFKGRRGTVLNDAC